MTPMRWRTALASVLIAVAPLIGAAPAAAACAADSDCDLLRRVAAADAYLAERPGTVGYVLRDRQTGFVHRNAEAAEPVWTASTIKLAMVDDLLVKNRIGAITLSASDRQLMAAMLHSSDDDAADTLWARYGGTDHRAFNDDFAALGLTGFRPQPGYSSVYPYWGFQKAAADDLDRLMTFTLTALDPADTAAVVGELQHVAPDQQWGVWGAGPQLAPGNKDGWSREDSGWVTNSVGFAGAQQRYTLAVMNDLGSAGGYDDGVATTTHLAELLLAGR
ncbi:hypothetical protein MCHLDSM_03417 [Mycolicibacterium chlorophenolicum]|uniref:Lipoprotein LppW n=2 Tax=Mycolicibacterium chlorophenolicum TaxID=37916 RepID=A0A0J6VYJ8_9MYCO|nr:hypothetical protein MCHLDSM_03417 [Mycolicibacterium chlorophenolicum]